MANMVVTTGLNLLSGVANALNGPNQAGREPANPHHAATWGTEMRMPEVAEQNAGFILFNSTLAAPLIFTVTGLAFVAGVTITAIAVYKCRNRPAEFTVHTPSKQPNNSVTGIDEDGTSVTLSEPVIKKLNLLDAGSDEDKSLLNDGDNQRTNYNTGVFKEEKDKKKSENLDTEHQTNESNGIESGESFDTELNAKQLFLVSTTTSTSTAEHRFGLSTLDLDMLDQVVLEYQSNQRSDDLNNKEGVPEIEEVIRALSNDVNQSSITKEVVNSTESLIEKNSLSNLDTSDTTNDNT